MRKQVNDQPQKTESMARSVDVPIKITNGKLDFSARSQTLCSLAVLSQKYKEKVKSKEEKEVEEVQTQKVLHY